MSADAGQAARGEADGPSNFNAIDSDVPQEFLCLVGSPSNTFNGYVNDSTQDPAPHPTTEKDVNEFLTHLSKKSKTSPKYSTHDVYWADFLDAAKNLFGSGSAGGDGPVPQPGDILTIMVYNVGFFRRNFVDWSLSPHNPANKKVSAKSLLEHYLNWAILQQTTNDNVHEGKDDEVLKRPKRNTQYLEYIQKIPQRVAKKLPDVLVKLLLINHEKDITTYVQSGTFSGAQAFGPALKDAQARKDDVRPLVKPMNEVFTKMWPTKGGYIELDHNLALTDKFWDAAVTNSKKLWTPNRLKIAGVPASVLKKGADGSLDDTVDRDSEKSVRVRRFDYFGHSAFDKLFLMYGWGNEKGEAAGCSYGVKAPFLKESFDGRLTADSFFQLWGCFSGDPGGTAENLLPTFSKGVACHGKTDFSLGPMPQPSSGGSWTSFP